MLFFSFFSFSQCLDETVKKGYFDTDAFNSSDWWRSDVGSFNIEKNDFFYGTGALRVSVPSNNDNDVKIFTTNDCSFPVQKDEMWNVSMYVKGDLDNDLMISLIDADNKNQDIGNITFKISYRGWHYVRFMLKSTSSSGNVKFKLNFKSKGNYWLDNIILKKGSFNNWYVDDEGLDSNDGSIDNPFKTISKAINQENWNPGDIINVRKGEYKNIGYGSGERNRSNFKYYRGK